MPAAGGAVPAGLDRERVPARERETSRHLPRTETADRSETRHQSRRRKRSKRSQGFALDPGGRRDDGLGKEGCAGGTVWGRGVCERRLFGCRARALSPEALPCWGTVQTVLDAHSPFPKSPPHPDSKPRWQPPSRGDFGSVERGIARLLATTLSSGSTSAGCARNGPGAERPLRRRIRISSSAGPRPRTRP